MYDQTFNMNDEMSFQGTGHKSRDTPIRIAYETPLRSADSFSLINSADCQEMKNSFSMRLQECISKQDKQQFQQLQGVLEGLVWRCQAFELNDNIKSKEINRLNQQNHLLQERIQQIEMEKSIRLERTERTEGTDEKIKIQNTTEKKGKEEQDHMVEKQQDHMVEQQQDHMVEQEQGEPLQMEVQNEQLHSYQPSHEDEQGLAKVTEANPEFETDQKTQPAHAHLLRGCLSESKPMDKQVQQNKRDIHHLWDRVNVIYNYFMKKGAQGNNQQYYYKTEECQESGSCSFYLNHSDMHELLQRYSGEECKCKDRRVGRRLFKSIDQTMYRDQACQTDTQENIKTIQTLEQYVQAVVTTQDAECQPQQSEEQGMIMALAEQLYNYYGLRDGQTDHKDDLHFTCRIQRQDHHLTVPSQQLANAIQQIRSITLLNNKLEVQLITQLQNMINSRVQTMMEQAEDQVEEERVQRVQQQTQDILRHMGEQLAGLVQRDKQFFDRTINMKIENDYKSTREAMLRFLLEYIEQCTESQKGIYLLNKNTMKTLYQQGRG